MLLPTAVLGGVGLIAGVGLTIASRIFRVDEDPRIKKVRDILPGANCGGCGHAGCDAYAAAVVSGADEVNKCVVGQSETADAIANFLGYDRVASEPKTACSLCEGGYRADQKYEYSGVQDCRAAMHLFHGPIRCENGCLGLGTCVSVCKFNAIEIGSDNLPKFDTSLCVGCGACVQECPKGIIALTSAEADILRWNRQTECLSPCRQRCPAQIDIPRYIGHVRRGEYAQAILAIKERNPLPASTGRVCPELCAVKCRRTIHDDPLAINQLKRFAADWEMNSGKRLPVPAADFTG
ncbi:MAG: RnfABCDGE type electron transport complex subunit B, partial [Gemmatimonadota bacterium]